jgi:hypothetical protein
MTNLLAAKQCSKGGGWIRRAPRSLPGLQASMFCVHHFADIFRLIISEDDGLKPDKYSIS